MKIAIVSLLFVALVAVALYKLFRLDEWLAIRRLERNGDIGYELSFMERLTFKVKNKLRSFGMPLPFVFAIIIFCGAAGIAVIRFIFGGIITTILGAVVGVIIPIFILDIQANSHMKEYESNLEATMTLLTNAYIAEQDFVRAVRNNIDTIALKTPFKKFLDEIQYVDSNVERGIRRLDARIGNVYFTQWANVMILAQANREMMDQLMPVIESMNAAKSANIEAETAMASIWRDYFLMIGLSLCIPLIIKFAMPDWYPYLTDTTIGQVLSCALIVTLLISMLIAKKVNKRISA